MDAGTIRRERRDGESASRSGMKYAKVLDEEKKSKKELDHFEGR